MILPFHHPVRAVDITHSSNKWLSPLHIGSPRKCPSKWLLAARRSHQAHQPAAAILLLMTVRPAAACEVSPRCAALLNGHTDSLQGRRGAVMSASAHKYKSCTIKPLNLSPRCFWVREKERISYTTLEWYERAQRDEMWKCTLAKLLGHLHKVRKFNYHLWFICIGCTVGDNSILSFSVTRKLATQFCIWIRCVTLLNLLFLCIFLFII